ncbi:methyl-accepting chemotaxis protein, partial [Helicobacter aurati]
MKMSIVRKLQIGVVLVFSVLSVIFSVFNWFSAQANFIKHSNQNKKALLDITLLHINSYIGEKQNEITESALTLEQNPQFLERENIYDFLAKTARMSGFDAFYIAYVSDGQAIMSRKDENYSYPKIVVGQDGANFDVNKREWFRNAIASGRQGISKPYIDFVTGDLAITFFAPIRKNGVIVAEIIGDLYLRQFSEDIRGLKGSDTSRILLFEDLFYVTPSGKFIMEESGRPYVTSLKEGIQKYGDSPFEYFSHFDGELRFAVCGKASIGWFTCITTSQSDYRDELKQIALHALLRLLIGIVVFALMTNILVKFLLNPLKILDKNLHQFFEYLTYKIPKYKPDVIQRNDELGDMSDKINKNTELITYLQEQEKLLQKNFNEVIQEAKQGKFGKQIVVQSSNPNMISLCGSINEMSASLCKQITPDLSRILEVFKEANRGNFRNRIENPIGMEESVNMFIDSVVGMLQTSQNLANVLYTQSDSLNVSMNKLQESCTQQAITLGQTASKIDDIASSMNSVSIKSGEVIAQSEDIK